MSMNFDQKNWFFRAAFTPLRLGLELDTLSYSQVEAAEEVHRELLSRLAGTGRRDCALRATSSGVHFISTRVVFLELLKFHI